jgi:hypothetical protein
MITRAERRAVVAAKICGDAVPSSGLEGGSEFPSVEVGAIGGKDCGAGRRKRAVAVCRRDGRVSVNIGVTSERFEEVLSVGTGWDNGEQSAHREQCDEMAHVFLQGIGKE